jgi:ABC-type multidrug transport system ATPase subunit
VLENLDFSARKGELSCIVGRVGAGKSSLLQALLGDLWKVKGEVVVRGHIAYVAQQAWVMNASVRENIVFGHRWDPHFYNLTVEACALLDDFKTLPDGDQTEVGERGISLSGGQKARVTLARAVYARADVYLLDDVLSAVDQHVGRHIINRVLGRNGILCSKTRILATNAITVLKEADFIGLLRDKTIIEKGTFEQLLAMKGEIANLVRSNTTEDESESSDSSKEDQSLESPESLTVIDNEDEADSELSEMEEAQERLAPLARIRSTGSARRRESMHSLRRASTASHVRNKPSDEEGEIALKSRQTKEASEQGKVKWSVYGEYAKTSNLYAVAVYLVALLSAQTAGVLGNFWLKRWSEINEIEGRNPEIGKYIGIYFAFGIGSAALVILQTLILWIFCSIEVYFVFPPLGFAALRRLC